MRDVILSKLRVGRDVDRGVDLRRAHDVRIPDDDVRVGDAVALPFDCGIRREAAPGARDLLACLSPVAVGRVGRAYADARGALRHDSG
jgi:hypothetical protein